MPNLPAFVFDFTYESTDSDYHVPFPSGQIPTKQHRFQMRTPFLLLFLFLIKLAQASSGDRDPAFQACVSKKLAEPCSLSLSLLLTRWTCEDDAKYQCTHILTDKAERTGAPIEQFYGKWAFKRFAGIQEPASVLFSLLNMVAHIRGGKKLQQKISKEHPMRPYYVTFTWFNINLWVWSSVFHTRGMFSR